MVASVLVEKPLPFCLPSNSHRTRKGRGLSGRSWIEGKTRTNGLRLTRILFLFLKGLDRRLALHTDASPRSKLKYEALEAKSLVMKVWPTSSIQIQCHTAPETKTGDRSHGHQCFAASGRVGSLGTKSMPHTAKRLSVQTSNSERRRRKPPFGSFLNFGNRSSRRQASRDERAIPSSSQTSVSVSHCSRLTVIRCSLLL